MCRYGQRDPLTEYKLEGFELFKDMLARVRRNVIYNVYVFTPTRMDKIDDEGADGKSLSLIHISEPTRPY